jgi:hypothetical protein
VLQRLVELAAQLGVLGTQPGHLGEQFADQALQGRDVVGQRGIRGKGQGLHAPSNPGAAAR